MPAIEAEVVQQLQFLLGLAGAQSGSMPSWASPEIRKSGTSDGAVPRDQVHFKQRKLDDEAKARAVALFDSTVVGNTVVVQDLRAADGLEAGVRSDHPARC